MQLNGIGSGHSSEMHNITRCMHDHGDEQRGGVKVPSTPGAAAKFAMRTHQEQNTQPTLSDLLQQLFTDGKERLLGIWRGSEISAGEQTGGSAKTVSAGIQAENKNDASVINASRNNALIHQNPYFSAVTPQRQQAGALPVLRKIKLKAKAVAGQLTKHLPGRFSRFQDQGSFHTKKESSREDMRRRSKYRQDELEIDCVLTDESYLLDSYYRKGEYSQLTTSK